VGGIVDGARDGEDGGGGPDSAKAKEALVIFHANKDENSQTVISGKRIDDFDAAVVESARFIEYALLEYFRKWSSMETVFENAEKNLMDRLCELLDNKASRNNFITGEHSPQEILIEDLKYLHDFGVQISGDRRFNVEEIERNINRNVKDGDGRQIAWIPDVIKELAPELAYVKVAQDFLECKIETQEQPINKTEEVFDAFKFSEKKLCHHYNERHAQLDLELAFGKKPFCNLEPQYHSAKNIFQEGITIRRHQEYPHMVDIVRVITSEEEGVAVKKPNVQFVAIKGIDGSEVKVNLIINKEEGAGNHIIDNKVFFRKVILQDDGEVSFDDKIYYYDDSGVRQSFDINKIVKDGDIKTFLDNLGALKIRATCVKLYNDNQLQIVD
jgi:hypothetical protein